MPATRPRRVSTPNTIPRTASTGICGAFAAVGMALAVADADRVGNPAGPVRYGVDVCWDEAGGLDDSSTEDVVDAR